MAVESLIQEKSSFLHRTKEFIKKKKTQLLGATILSSALALGGCSIGGLENIVYTPAYFYPGKLVTLTGEAHEIYQPTYYKKALQKVSKDQLRDPHKKQLATSQENDDYNISDLNFPLVVYNSIDSNGRNIVVNLHEDFRFGINRQAIKRAKEALGSHKYIVRAYGNITHSDILNVDLYFLSFTDKDGKPALTIETDYDPIFTIMSWDMITWPINTNPKLSFGLWPPWQWGFFPPAYINGGWLWWADWDHDGIPSYFDEYPFLNYKTGQPVASPNPNWHNVNADLNRYNFTNLKEGKKDLVIPPENVTLHPDFVNIFARNRQSEEYMQKVIQGVAAARAKNSNANSNSVRYGKISQSELESMARSMGIRSDQLSKSYNRRHILIPGIYTGSSFSSMGSGASYGATNSGSSSFSAPKSSSEHSGSSSGSGEHRIKN